MKKLLILFIGAMLLCQIALAQDWAKTRLDNSPRHLEWIKIKHDNREVNCFIAYPEVKDKATAVVVIHEIFGLTDWARGDRSTCRSGLHRHCTRFTLGQRAKRRRHR